MTTAAMTVTAAACDRDRRDGTAYLARARREADCLIAEALCDLGERAMSRRARPRKPLGVRVVLACGAVIGAAFGIYSH